MLTQNSSTLLGSQSTTIASPIATPVDYILTGLGNSNTALSSTISLTDYSQIATPIDSSFIDSSFIDFPIYPVFLNDNSMGVANTLGSLSGTTTRTGFVGSNDSVDFYQFTGGGNVNITLTGLNADSDIELISDSNGNGLVDSGEVIASSYRGGTADESINLSAIGSGSYFVRVQQYSGDSNYTLRLSNSNPNNLLAIEDSFGDMSSYAYRDRSSNIGSSNTSNLYGFSLTSARDITLAMTGLSADADIRLIQDSNNNGVVDAGEVLASSTRGGSNNEAINKVLGAGNYFAQVIQYSGNSNYNFRLLSAAPEVNLTVNQVNAIDNPDTGWFGDNADYYSRISIGGSSTTTGAISNSNNIAPNWKHTAVATGQSTNIAVEMWDSDGGFAGADDHVDIDSGAGFRDLNISYDIVNNTVSGDVSGYGGSMLTVNGSGDADRAQLRFTVQEGDWYDNNLDDFYLTHLTRAFSADGSLSRSDMMTLMREAGDNGSVDATELADLRRIQSSMSGWMPEAVSNLANKVINSDVANSRSGIGNLFAGSSTAQLESLVGKWFMGSDRPDAAGIYRYAQGSLFQSGATLSDVAQGGVGDCYFIASLGAAAQDKPWVINSMFTDNNDGTFTVRFFKPDGSRDYVTVDRYLPTNAWGDAVYAGWNGGANTEANNELWVSLAEKAYSQLNESGWIGQDNTNSYAGIDGGWMAPVMNQISGLSTASQSINSMSKMDLVNLVNSNRMLTAGFVSGGGHGVYDSHAYTISSYNAATGLFHLNNPWGTSHADVTWDQLLSLHAVIQSTTV